MGSLLSDLNDYPLTDDLYTCIERVQAKPFDSDHVEQVTAAEQLYGRQLIFRISHGELRSELNLLSEAYSPDILQRAERVLLEQKRKHSWLFLDYLTKESSLEEHPDNDAILDNHIKPWVGYLRVLNPWLSFAIQIAIIEGCPFYWTGFML